ncbi:MAG: nucleotidyl transferase AbiEii/AbiGii toxin family protein [Candidatus Micrarchaeia archaeon]
MITRKELESVGRSLGFNTYQAEKDYLQHAFLASLYTVSSNEFVFKGGTALQKAFGLDRFSEDLDFTFIGKSEEVGRLIERAVRELEKMTEARESKKEEKLDSISIKLKVKGPLYDGSERSVQTILIEISLREEVLKTPLAKRIVPPYADLRPYVALCMNLDEMLAEKIRAIMTREKPRDVYDAWFLLKKNAVFSKEQANLKLAYYGKRFEFSQFEKAVRSKQKIWEKELNVLMKNVPSSKETSEELLRLLKKYEV